MDTAHLFRPEPPPTMQDSNADKLGHGAGDKVDDGLLHLVYASTASRRFTEHDLPSIVERSRDKNAEVGITAMLLYQEGTFLHAIEGSKPAVRALFDKVATDERHDHVQCLVTVSVAKRQFAGQPMGFHQFADEDVEFDVSEGEGMDLIYHPSHLSWRACLSLRLLARFRSSG